jgi:hypothetical protein
MSLFIGSDNNRVLLKGEGITVSVHNGAFIEYLGNYYTKNLVKYRYDHQVVPFIGRVASARIKDAVTIGIFIHPLYVYLENEWYKIINYKDPVYRSYFLYPHLITSDKESSYRFNLEIDSIKSAVISEVDFRDMKQLDLEYPT